MSSARAQFLSDIVTKDGPYVDVRAYGSALTDVTINAAIAAIGADNVMLVIPPGTWAISNTITVPANITLRILRGALLDVLSGTSININGPFECGLYPAFALDNNDVSFSDSAIDQIYLEWFGGAGDGTTDNTLAFVCAHSAQSTPTIKLLEGIYLYTGASATWDPATFGGMYFNKNGAKIIGSGSYVTELRNNHATYRGMVIASQYFALKDVKVTSIGTGVTLEIRGQHSELENIIFDGQTGTDYMLYVNAATCTNGRNLIFADGVSGGMTIGNSGGTSLTNGTNWFNIQGGTSLSKPLVYVGPYCTGNSFFSVLLDGGCTGGAFVVEGAFSTYVYGYYTEVSSTVNAYYIIRIEDAVNTHFHGGRIAHTTDVWTGKPLILVKGALTRNVSFTGFRLFNNVAAETVGPFDIDSNFYGLSLRDITTNWAATGLNGVEMAGSVIGVNIDGWTDENAAMTHVIKGNNVKLSNMYSGDINLATGTNQTVINCTGDITGTGATTCERIPEVTEALTANGAAFAGAGYTTLNSLGGAISVTLAAGGLVGAVKTFYMIADGGDISLTVANHETSSPEIFTFDDVGDTLVLQWTGAIWFTVKNIGVTVP